MSGLSGDNVLSRALGARTAVLILAASACMPSRRPPPPVPPSPPIASPAECGKDLGPSPFAKPEAVHVLLANFKAGWKTEEAFGGSVSEQLDRELERFRDEYLRSRKHIDIPVPEGSAEVRRVPCFVTSHEHAEAMLGRP